MKIIIAITVALAFLAGACFLFGSLFGWIGVIGVTTIFTVICLFYFYRTMKLLSIIQSMPEGQTPHAQYLHHHITEGMTLVKIVQIAQALGKKISLQPLIYTWEDKEHRVTVTIENERATHIELTPLNNQNETV